MSRHCLLVFFVFFIFLFLTTCQSSWAKDKSANDLATLVSWMSGSFSSHEQAANDTNYFDIHLQMARIWKDRTDGYWLYVEQAVAAYVDRPYRQRVYRVTQTGDNEFTSQIFTMNDPLRFAGEWKKEAPLATLTPDSLEDRAGCAVVLHRKDEKAFAGSTIGKECPSNLRDAAYATSEVVVTEEALISWDRGYDEKGTQVWGATEGGYIFKKVKPAK